jgi:3-methyladenine DNA glycosylase/8-oxoguanine DNA glycosylase
VILRLPLPADFHFDAVVRSHGWYDLPPFAYDQAAGTLSTRVSSGAAVARIEFHEAGGALEARASGLDRSALAAIARRVFSLDVALDGFAAGLVATPDLARAFARAGGRMLRAPTAFEDAVKMLFTTNCTWAATRGMVVRLIAEAGSEGAFPSADAVARLGAARLKARVRCGYRAVALSRLARRVATGRLDLAAWERRDLAAQEARAAILAEHGFGPYAAEGLLRILGRHDFFAIDSWIRQKYRRLHRGPARSTDSSIARRYARFGQYRGLALWLDMTKDWHERH